MQKPLSSEFPEYYQAYVNKVDTDDLIPTLQTNLDQVVDFFQNIPEHKYDHKYEEGKWSIKEVLIHLSDVERVMSYRAFRISRNDKTKIEGYDHNAYIFDHDFSHRTKEDAIQDFINVRKASESLLKSIPTSSYTLEGNANGSPITTRSLAYILVGHSLHHMDILKERYL